MISHFTLRHLAAIGLAGMLVALFTVGRHGIHWIHFWNRAAADAAFVMLCLTLVIGPAVRLYPRASRLLGWRRELGIWSAILAFVHVGIYAHGAFDWDVTQFFSRGREGERVLLENAFGAANWVGLVALAYALVLALTSNDLSQRLLGRAWPRLQSQSQALLVLSALHAGIFLYLVINAGYGLFLYGFWGALGVVTAIRLWAFGRTARRLTRVRAASPPAGGE